AAGPVFDEVGDIADSVAVGEEVPAASAVAVVVEPGAEDEKLHHSALLAPVIRAAVQLDADALARLVGGGGGGAEARVRGVEEGAAGEVLQVPGYGDNAGDGGGF
ncbi:hypothetical protein V500_10152, partial [Pseudogymnoascus sp. VKM F-4518 (FW-2643)]